MLLRLLPLLLAAPLAAGDTLRLAACPKEPLVVGEYKNNGKKCVRNREVRDREVVDADCPPGTGYRNYKCRSAASGQKDPVQPSCPDRYQLYGNMCRAWCPKGYQQTSGQCILPQDALSSHYMSCPKGHRRMDAFCVEDLAECQVAAPGTFHYKDGKCERTRQILPRDYTALKKGEDCPPTQVVVRSGAEGRRYCQDPCPDFYRARKGKCELRKCVVRADQIDTQIMCPEGSFQVSLVSE